MAASDADKSRCYVEFIIMTRERLYDIHISHACVSERANYARAFRSPTIDTCAEYRESIIINCTHRRAPLCDFAINKNQPQLIGVRYAQAKTLDAWQKKKEREREKELRYFSRTFIFRAHSVITKRVIIYTLPCRIPPRMRFLLAGPFTKRSAAAPVFFLRLSIFR